MFDAVKTQIWSDATLRNDFSAAVTLYKDFLEQSNAAKDPRSSNISSVAHGKAPATTRTKAPDNGNGPVDMSVEDRYYTPKEYEKLSIAKKNGLRAKRKARGHNPKKGQGKSPHKGGQSYTKKFEKRVISALRRLNTDDSDDSDSEEQRMEEPTTNRNNQALRRREE